MFDNIGRRSFIKLSGAVLGGVATGTTVTAAASTDRFILDVGTSVSDDDVSTIRAAGLSVVHRLDPIGVVVVQGTESTVEGLGYQYGADTRYRLDSPVSAVTRADVSGTGSEPSGSGTPTTDEPYYDLQWDKQVQHVLDAHEVTRGAGTRVAVIDAGIQADHPDLQGQVNEKLSRNFSGDGYGVGKGYGGGHGTHVSGIIAAHDHNDVGVLGTAPATELVDCRVFPYGEGAPFSDVLAAVVYSAQIECDVANLSLGAYPIPRQGLGSFYGKLLNRMTTYANSRGTLLVVAAGNDSADLQHDGSVVSLPNEAANVMSISATGPIGFMWGKTGLRESYTHPAFYTNYGTNAIDVSAPGGNADLSAIGTGADWYYDLVYNTYVEVEFDQQTGDYTFTDTYAWLAGTSMAAPQVTAAAALVKSQHPDWRPDQVAAALERTAETVGEKAYSGSGFLNPNAAVRL